MEKYLKKILGVATYFYRKATAPVEHEITSINNPSSFVKAKANSFGIERLQLSFVNYDSETKKHVNRLAQNIVRQFLLLLLVVFTKKKLEVKTFALMVKPLAAILQFPLD